MREFASPQVVRFGAIEVTALPAIQLGRLFYKLDHTCLDRFRRGVAQPVVSTHAFSI